MLPLHGLLQEVLGSTEAMPQSASGGSSGRSLAVIWGSTLNGLLIGSLSVNLLPTLTWLCTTMSPPCSRRILRLTGAPRPVPRAFHDFTFHRHPALGETRETRETLPEL